MVLKRDPESEYPWKRLNDIPGRCTLLRQV